MNAAIIPFPLKHEPKFTAKLDHSILELEAIHRIARTKSALKQAQAEYAWLKRHRP